jgi:hypothetical protein
MPFDATQTQEMVKKAEEDFPNLVRCDLWRFTAPRKTNLAEQKHTNCVLQEKNEALQMEADQQVGVTCRQSENPSASTQVLSE